MAELSPSRRENGGSPLPMSVRFWGVRGALPCPGPQTLRYGGNTACVEVRCGSRLLILDGGSGLRPLGEELARNGESIDADILFSHFHLDHIIGLPFFQPAFHPANRFRLWAASQDEGTLADAMAKLMAPPLFPVGPDVLRARLEHRDFRCGDNLAIQSGIAARTAPLHHPGGAAGYRIEYAGRSLAYVTDTEHRPEVMDANVLALADRADLMIYDSNYTPAEYHGHEGWGHSTWEEGVRLADAAGVGRLVLFHHDPAHDDDMMDEIERQATARRPGTIVAREGVAVRL